MWTVRRFLVEECQPRVDPSATTTARAYRVAVDVLERGPSRVPFSAETA